MFRSKVLFIKQNSLIEIKSSRIFLKMENEKRQFSTGNKEGKGKHPPHLKGKAIGMFYANRNKAKNKSEKELPRVPVIVNEKKISTVLLNLKKKVYKELNGRSSPFCTKSSFMWKYWTHLHDSEIVENETDIAIKDGSSQIKQKEMVDISLFEEHQYMQKNKTYEKMFQFRRELPAFKKKMDVIDMIEKNQVILLTGETGCGKTTQVPQFVLDHYIESGYGSVCKIVCTQPRRISAISVAERVANERNCPCGNGSAIGYQIRLESKQPREYGSIMYCTTGIILQWLQSDALLSSYSHIFVDEVHERDLLSDFLLVVLKDLLPKRPDLRVILMSATLDSDTFSKYFWDCPKINIEGFTYPVEVFTLEDAIEQTKYDPNSKKRKRKNELEEVEEFYHDSYIMNKYTLDTMDTIFHWDEKDIDLILIVELLKHIDSHQKEGAILVFLTGWEEIKKLHNTLLENVLFSSSKFVILPLHSMLTTANQREVFNRPPQGVRKIVLATNIAETSVTIDDIVYVVDCGKIKMTNFDAEHNISSLLPEWVALSNIKQRRGRAGRTQPGICYHLVSKFRMSQLDAHQLPEMLRTRLEEMILKIKILKLGKVKPFLEKTMQPPDLATVDLSLNLLLKMNALDNDEKLTPLGYHLASLPMDPHLGKMILYGAIFSCLDPILSIAASLNFKDPFCFPLGKESLVDEIRHKFAGDTQSDHLMLARVVKEYENAERTRSGYRFCNDNFLSISTTSMISKLKRQFAGYLHDLRFLECANYDRAIYNINSDNEKLLKAIICAGLYPNVVRILKKPSKSPFRPDMFRLFTADKTRVAFHKKSVNIQENPLCGPFLIFHVKIKSSKVFLHDSTVVSSFPVLLFGGEIDVVSESSWGFIIDKWITFECHVRHAKIIKDLRTELDDLLRFKICNPSVTNWSSDTKEGCLLKLVIDLISSEVQEKKPSSTLWSYGGPGTSSTSHQSVQSDSD